ncbi:MAG: DUF3313 domain-containing protein [Xanthomonadales bacterium]|nr:DUF3313 domain-containing protein [Xanthomonadales bacterium]
MTLKAVAKSGFILSLLAAGSLQAANDKLPEVTVDGLHHISDTELAIVYAQPGVDLGQYNKVYLLDAHVAFKKNWQRDQQRSSGLRVSSSDMEKMKSELAGLFKEVFTTTLEEGGYELVTERGDDVLIVKPAIINLDVTVPDTMTTGFTRSYAESAGEMTLYVELYDSVTDDLIGKALDRKRDRKTGYFQWQNRVTNRAAANRILKEWANVLKEGLDAARGDNNG